MKNRILSVIVAVCSALSLTACGRDDNKNSAPVNTNSVSAGGIFNIGNAGVSSDSADSSSQAGADNIYVSEVSAHGNTQTDWDGLWRGDGFEIRIYDVDENIEIAYAEVDGEMNSSIDDLTLDGNTLTGTFSYNPQDYNPEGENVPYEELREFTLTRDGNKLHFYCKVSAFFFGGASDSFETSGDLVKVN